MSGNKYSARRTLCRQNHEHASAKESRWCNDLTLLERSGEITHLEVEPQFIFTVDGLEVKHENGRKAVFSPDFSYRERDGRKIALEVKGGSATKTEAYTLRKAFFRAIWPHITLREV